MNTANATPHPLERALSEEERAAWQSGDYERADLLGCLLDQAEELQRNEDARDAALTEAEDNYEQCQEDWSKHIDTMREQAQALRLLIESAERISRRQILAKLEELEDAIEEPQK